MLLHNLKRENIINVPSKILVDFVPITYENIEMVQSIRGSAYVGMFRDYLNKGCYGIYACVDNAVIGYGWLKKDSSYDMFYKINHGVGYLSSFYVSDTYRGNNIYPALINQLVSLSNYNEYYIAAYDTNISSLKGIEKVGSAFVRKDVFMRIMKLTFLKKYLK